MFRLQGSLMYPLTYELAFRYFYFTFVYNETVLYFLCDCALLIINHSDELPERSLLISYHTDELNQSSALRKMVKEADDTVRSFQTKLSTPQWLLFYGLRQYLYIQEN